MSLDCADLFGLRFEADVSAGIVGFFGVKNWGAEDRKCVDGTRVDRLVFLQTGLCLPPVRTDLVQ